MIEGISLLNRKNTIYSCKMD